MTFQMLNKNRRLYSFDSKLLETDYLSILFADDEPLIRMLVEDIFTDAGHEIMLAKNGQTRCGAWQTHRNASLRLFQT